MTSLRYGPPPYATCVTNAAFLTNNLVPSLSMQAFPLKAFWCLSLWHLQLQSLPRDIFQLIELLLVELAESLTLSVQLGLEGSCLGQIFHTTSFLEAASCLPV